MNVIFSCYSSMFTVRHETMLLSYIYATSDYVRSCDALMFTDSHLVSSDFVGFPVIICKSVQSSAQRQRYINHVNSAFSNMAQSRLQEACLDWRKHFSFPPPQTSCQKKQNNALSVCLRLLSLLSTKGYQRLLRTWLDHASLCLFELQPVTSGRETGWGLCLIMEQSAAVCGERLWWLASCSEFGNPHLRQRSSTICYHEFIIRHHKASALTESNSHRLHNAKCDSVQRYLQDYILSPLYNNRALPVLISRDL